MKKHLIVLCLYVSIPWLLSSPIFAETLAPVTPSIHPELKLHSERFVKKIYTVTDRVYSAVGWNVAGIVMIEGDDGIIMVDAGLRPVAKSCRNSERSPANRLSP